MRYLPTGEWMQKADNYTIHEIGIPSMVLMERAALAAVAVMEQEKINTQNAGGLRLRQQRRRRLCSCAPVKRKRL